jgi:hypothetical protein
MIAQSINSAISISLSQGRFLSPEWGAGREADGKGQRVGEDFNFLLSHLYAFPVPLSPGRDSPAKRRFLILDTAATATGEDKTA